MKAEPALLARVRTIFPDASAEGYSVGGTFELDDVIPALAELGIEATIKNFSNSMMIGTREKIAHLETEQKLLRQQIAQDGMLIQIHVPNVGLYTVDEVEVLDDACTDSLQARLDDGWRILCVCPPNGQRRPDYILGRTKPKDERS